MAAIKAVMYVFKKNHYHLKLNIVVTYNMSFHTIFYELYLFTFQIWKRSN